MLDFRRLEDRPMRTLATFENAYRVAGRLSDAASGSYVIVATGDVLQPYRVERASAQSNAVAYFLTAGFHSATSLRTCRADEVEFARP